VQIAGAAVVAFRVRWVSFPRVVLAVVEVQDSQHEV
jgi:hypothetical protein